MKYRWIHECPKPDMIVGEREYTVGTWPFRKKKTAPIYDTRQVEWECDCGAKWSWSCGRDYGLWFCDYRPEVWKDYYEGK